MVSKTAERISGGRCARRDKFDVCAERCDQRRSRIERAEHYTPVWPIIAAWRPDVRPSARLSALLRPSDGRQRWPSCLPGRRQGRRAAVSDMSASNETFPSIRQLSRPSSIDHRRTPWPKSYDKTGIHTSGLERPIITPLGSRDSFQSTSRTGHRNAALSLRVSLNCLFPFTRPTANC